MGTDMNEFSENLTYIPNSRYNTKYKFLQFSMMSNTNKCESKNMATTVYQGLTVMFIYYGSCFPRIATCFSHKKPHFS